MSDLPPFTPEPPAPDDEDPTVEILPPLDLNEPFGPAEEQTKAVVVEADTAFVPHPALLDQQNSPANSASAGGPRPMFVIRALKRRTGLMAIVAVATFLSVFGLLLLLFPAGPSSPFHRAPAGPGARSSAVASSVAASMATPTPGQTTTASPTTSPTPALMPMLPPASKNCRVASITITREAGSLTAHLTIINTSSTVINHWTLVFLFSDKPAWVTYVSNGVFEQVGHQVTISSPDYGTAIVPGSSSYTSFLATWNGNNSMPPSFRVNSLMCRSYSDD